MQLWYVCMYMYINVGWKTSKTGLNNVASDQLLYARSNRYLGLLAAISWHWIRLACSGWPAGFESTCVWSSKVKDRLHLKRWSLSFTHIFLIVGTPDCCVYYGSQAWVTWTSRSGHVKLIICFPCPRYWKLGSVGRIKKKGKKRQKYL